jgi:hypothetical protein
VPFLTAEAARFGNGHSLHPDLRQRLTDVVEFVWLYDGSNELH